MKRSKTSQTSAGSVLVNLRLIVTGLAGQQHPGGLAGNDDLGLHWHDVAAARVVEQRGGALERRELLEVLDRGEDEQDLAARVGVERSLRGEPAEIDALAAVDRRLGALGSKSEEEVRVEAGLDLRGCDPARELDERGGVDALDRGLFGELADRRRAVGLVALALVRVDRAAGEDPDAGHKAGVGIALDEQDLEPVA